VYSVQAVSGRYDLVEGLYHRILVCRVDRAGTIALAESENRFNDRELCGRCVEPCIHMLALDTSKRRFPV
jgi:hypothetical protein